MGEAVEMVSGALVLGVLIGLAVGVFSQWVS